MAIVENKASEIGDVILIKASVPIIGLVTLASFTDSTVNETGAKFFTKEFRYSTDGINYSAWIPLTIPNVDAVEVEPLGVFMVEYKYTRSGVEASGPDLEFNQVELTGTFGAKECGPVYQNSIFAQFFSCTDACVLSWMINVLEKLYEQGILPKYIQRGDQGNDSNQDKDFLEFWKTITQYFAYIVCYARQWELSKVSGNYEILQQYLRAQTVILCGGEPQEDLIHIMNHTYDEARHRGTFEIIKTKLEDERPVDGEWHRLYCHLGACTDWYFSNTSNYNIGWVGDKASPLWQGNYQEKGLTKAYEDGQDVTDVDNYPYIGTPTIVTGPGPYGPDIDTMEFSAVAADDFEGIGCFDGAKKQYIPIDPKCSYEVTFWARTGNEALLAFGIDCFDHAKNPVAPKGTLDAFFEIEEDEFFNQYKVTGTHWRFVRGIIYGEDHRLKPGEFWEDYAIEGMNDLLDPSFYNGGVSYGVGLRNTILGLEAGHLHLKFNRRAEVCYICPKIWIDNQDQLGISGTFNFWDIKVRHLGTHYSTGFEQPSNFIKTKVKNMNQNYTNAKTEELVREFLIPYNSTFKTTFINPPETTSVDDVTGIILDTDVRFTDPLTSNIFGDERYLVWDGTKLLLYQYDSDGEIWVLTDNIVGSITYSTTTRNCFAYDDGQWNFSSN